MTSSHAERVQHEINSELRELLLAALDCWELTNLEQCSVLSIDAPTLLRLRERSAELPEGEPAVRARFLVTLAELLTALFPERPDIRNTWVRRQNIKLDGATPLNLMMTGRLDDTKRVVRFAQYQTTQ